MHLYAVGHKGKFMHSEIFFIPLSASDRKRGFPGMPIRNAIRNIGEAKNQVKALPLMRQIISLFNRFSSWYQYCKF
jgi:hypothetical protein